MLESCMASNLVRLQSLLYFGNQIILRRSDILFLCMFFNILQLFLILYSFCLKFNYLYLSSTKCIIRLIILHTFNLFLLKSRFNCTISLCKKICVSFNNKLLHLLLKIWVNAIYWFRILKYKHILNLWKYKLLILIQ